MLDSLEEPLRLPAPASVPPRPAVPIAAAIVPVVGAVVLWRLTGSVYALWFAALGPLMAAASFLDGLRTTRRMRRRSTRESTAAIAALGDEVDERHADERDRAWRRTPDVVGYARAADEIWRTVPGRDAVLVVGRGVGTSAVRLEGEAAADDARGLRRRARRLDDAPITVPLAAGIAVCGPAVTAAAVVRALALQVCLANAPGVVRLTGDTAHLDRMPHADATRGGVLFLGAGDRPVPDDVDIPIVRVAEGDPPPPRCAAVLTLGGAGRARLDHDGSSREVHVEAVSVEQTRDIAAALAARAETLGQRVDGAVSLDQLPSIPGGRESLAVAIGVSGGQPVVLDLVADGPHAVVIGLTGSGKSELLTTWIVGMCRTRSPQEVAFLLVDFKGGRTFEALEALPHVTGVLTDLDEARALRAVESLRAEIRHRERVLARHTARDIADAGDALARLVIVVDEYAALVTARPELHDLFADIAARGRALGMHLILASQRASGAFRDGVLANAPLRIALRVTDAADSRTVLGQDDAVRLPGTAAARGTALVRRGSDAGARTTRIARCDEASLAAAVARGRDAVPARRPWMPPLPERLDVDDVRRLAAAAALRGADGAGADGAGGAGAIVLGIADEPEEQRQVPVALPPDLGGVAVIGGPGSGRTSLLRAIATQATAAVWVPSDPERAWDAVQAMDAAARGSVILIDDADAVAARLPGEYSAAWVAALELLAREARGRGLTLVIAVTRVSGGVARVLDLVPGRALLPMASRADHVAAGGEAIDFVSGAQPGRGRWGRRLVQFALPSASAVGGTVVDADAAPVISLSPRRPTAFVVAAGGAGEGIRAWAERAGRRVRGVEDAAASTAPLAPGDVLIGTPDAWLAQWGVLAEARERCELLVDAACAQEYRAVTGRRELPPYAAPGAGRAWLLAPGAAARRVTLPSAR